MRANWRARVKRCTFLACTNQCTLTRFETFHLPSNRKSLIQQMRPTAVEVNSVYRSLGNGLWSIKDLSMSPWHCGFSSFDSYLLQLLDSLDPATKFHVKADPCWPFICYDIGDIGFGPITAATAGKMTILMRALSTPNYPQLIRIGMIWNDDVERVTPNSFKFWCHGVFSRAVKTFTYIMYRLDIINVNALKVEDGQCDKASQFLSTS